MKNCIGALILAVAIAVTPACHPSTSGGGLTQAQVHTILIDASFGIDFACTVQWLNPDQCNLARNVLDDASLAVQAQTTGGWAAAAKAVLIREEAKLPPGSKLRPYFDAAIILL